MNIKIVQIIINNMDYIANEIAGILQSNFNSQIWNQYLRLHIPNFYYERGWFGWIGNKYEAYDQVYSPIANRGDIIIDLVDNHFENITKNAFTKEERNILNKYFFKIKENLDEIKEINEKRILIDFMYGVSLHAKMGSSCEFITRHFYEKGYFRNEEFIDMGMGV